jgi:hypothetical protein
VLFCLFLIFACQALYAQEEKVLEEIAQEDNRNGLTVNLGADIMSRYIWRGMDFGNSPAIQPNLSLSWNGFNIGAWGTYAFTGHDTKINDTTIVNEGAYMETDLFVTYTYKWFTAMVFDYFIVNGLNPNTGNRYFNYRNATTGHTFEGCLSFQGPESFPMQVLASTLFYGDDKNKDSTGTYGKGTKNNFSTYFELAYKINLTKVRIGLKPFIGGIPFGSSWYGPYAGVTNIGITATKEIQITDKYALPVQVSVITNPQSQSIFFTFGISL